MNATLSDEAREIVDQVREWPADSRLALVAEIMCTITYDPGSRRKSLRSLLGRIRTQDPPDDAACQAMLEDELLSRHGQ
jgi:hypothetical protein